MGEAILYNKSVVADKQYNWNKAFNNEDFISYIINAIPINYVGLEEFIPAYEYMDKRNFVTISFPNCWMNIGSHAFDGCTRISYANFNSQKFESYSVYIIDEYAFRNCYNLESIDLGIARHIKSHAFENLHNLSAFRNEYAPYPYQLLNIEDYAFANCEKLSLFSGYGYQYINSIGDYAFYNCGFSTLNSIGSYICSKIGSHAFENCKSLSYINNLNFSGVVSSIFMDIGDYAFAGCSNLFNFICYALGNIGSHAFEGCTKLNVFASTYYTAPWCKKIGAYAFNGCNSLYSIMFNPANSFPCEVGDYAFANCGNLYSIVIYNVSKVGSHILDNASIYTFCLSGVSNDSTLNISSDVFNNVLSITYLSLFSFFSISSYAFQSLNLSSVLAVDITYIGSHAFENCETLYYFQANTSYSTGVYCGEYAFTGCTSLSTVTAGLNYVGSHAFDGCSNIKYIQGPPYIRYVGPYAFYNCSQLNAFYMTGLSCEYIGSHAFDGCSNISSIYLSLVSSLPILESIDAFDNISDYTIYVLSDIYSDYINDSIWGLLSDHISVSSY